MIYRTVSGSVYEVAPGSRAVRRLSGGPQTSNRVAPDGEWRACVDVLVGGVGKPLLIVWRAVGDHIEATRTSDVESIERDAKPSDDAAGPATYAPTFNFARTVRFA